MRAAESRSVYGQSVTSAAKAPAVNEQLTDNTSKMQTAKASASALVAGTGNSVELTPETSTAYEPAPSRHSAITTRFFLQKAQRSSFPS